MASTKFSSYGHDIPNSPVHSNMNSNYSQRDYQYQNQPESQENEFKENLSQIITKIKHIYSLPDQIQGLNTSSSLFFQWFVKFNYLLRNGLSLTTNDIRQIVAKKENLRVAHRNELKIVKYQEVSDYLAFVNTNNKIYLIKAGSLDVFQSFDVMGTIQSLDFHPYKKLWLAIATKNQVKILYPETDEETFFSSLSSQSRDSHSNVSKLDIFLTLNLTCTSIEFSPDGRYLAMINEHSSHLYLWDFESKRLRPHLEYGAVFNKIKWSPDGTYLAATCDKTKTLFVFEVSTWQKQKWVLKASVTQLAWSFDTCRLFLFLKEVAEIREIIDIQLEKSKIVYKRKEVEFRMARKYRVGLENPDNIQAFAFCFELDRLRYVYVESIKNREITKLGTITETYDEKIISEDSEGKKSVKELFFIIKPGKLYDQKQPIIYKVE